jgi:hypothetical protein
MKGLSEPLALYELRAIGGRHAHGGSRPAPEPEVAVSLPVACWVIEGKIVGAGEIGGRVVRLGRRVLAARLDAPVPPLTNLRLRLDYDGGRRSGDIYGKVTGEEPGAPGPVTRIHLTSLTEEDAAAVEALVAAGAPG